MLVLKNYILLYIFLFHLVTYTVSTAQCPEDVNEFVIRTQQDWDYFTSTYPECAEWNIFKVNNKFIGYPKPGLYLAQLFGMLVVMLLALKLVFKKLSWD